jgi:hypothetical protein
MLRRFPEDGKSVLEGASPLEAQVSKILDIRDGVAIYDDAQLRKPPDWTYLPA